MSAVILAAYASLFTLGLLDNVRGPFLFEIQQELGLSGSGGSAFFGAASLLSFFGAHYAHGLLKRRDALSVLSVVSLVFALGFAGISRAPNFSMLLLCSAVFGWGYGSLNVLQNVLVSKGAPAHLRRRYLNGLQSMYGLAAWAAPVTATSLRSLGLDWRAIFLILSVLPTLLSAFAWHHRGEVQAEERAPGKESWSHKENLARYGFMALLAVYLWGELSLSTRLVLWLRTEQGFSPESADGQLALFFILMLGGRMGLAFLELRFIGNRALLAVSALLSAAVYLGGLKISPYLVAWCGLTLAPFFPALMDEIAHVFGGKAPRAMGSVIGAGNLSIFAMHLSVGALTDFYSLSGALLVGPAALLITGMGLIWSRFR